MKLWDDLQLDQINQMPDNTNDNLNLLQLLERQKQLYLQALELENEMAKVIEEKNFARVAELNSQKTEHLEKTSQAFQQMQPLLAECKNESGVIPDDDAETLRQELKNLLAQIDQVQQKNIAEVSKLKEKIFGDLKGTELAKKVAKGYRPSRESIRSKYDTRR